MKKYFKYALLFAAISTMTLTTTSCSSDDNNENTEATTSSEMQAIAENYVKNVVEPTYTDLATNTQTLYEACQNLYAKRKAGTLTQTDIDAACNAFKTARKYWEESESFLYGAATDNNIDPHIDSWPLDHDQLVKALNDKDVIAGINGAQADKFVYEKNHDFDSVLGFHGLEFILFRNGANRTLAALTAENETEKQLTSIKTLDECAFAVAVAGDLRNMTSQLAYGWM
jgi:predicted lipoprotein